MKRIILALLAVVTATTVMAQTSLNSKISDVESIKVSGNLKVTLVKSDDPYFNLVLENTNEENVDWSISNNQLSVRLKQPLTVGGNKIVGKGELTIGYDVDQLDEVITSAKAELFHDGVYKGKQLTIDASSNSVVAMEVKVYSLDIKAGGGATTSITGAADIISINGASNASVNTVAMACEAATVKTSTNAECYVTATKKLDLKASTNSKIYYKGEPEVLTSNASSFALIEGF